MLLEQYAGIPKLFLHKVRFQCPPRRLPAQSMDDLGFVSRMRKRSAVGLGLAAAAIVSASVPSVPPHHHASLVAPTPVTVEPISDAAIPSHIPDHLRRSADAVALVRRSATTKLDPRRIWGKQSKRKCATAIEKACRVREAKAHIA